MSEQSQPQSGIELETSFFPLAFLLNWFPPKVIIDGHDPGKVTWGRMFIPVAPGQHQIHVSFPYLFAEAGKSMATVDVYDGHVTSMTYRAPFWLVFLAGKLNVVENYPIGSRPMAPIPLVWGGQPVQQAPMQAAQPQQPVHATPSAAPAAASDATPAGWHPDPMARHEMRYWDGGTWTSHVSDQGVQSSDAAS